MAEGGSPHEVPDNPRTVKDSHLLDCPICLEQLHQPKSLPCLHSFCQECLSTFITKDLSGKMASATAFPCPVCRKMTQPVNPSEDKEKWAQQFQTNDLVKDMITVLTQDPMYCKPCGKKGNTGTPATIWCKTCDVLLCENCKVNVHDMLMDRCDTVDVTGKNGIMQRQVTKQIRCEKHTKKMDYYCEDHQILGCSRCITIDHRRCDLVTTTHEYCDKLKRDSRLDDLKMSLQKTTEAVELLIKEFGEQLQILVEDQDAGLQSLADLRQRVDTRLDALQKNVTDDLISSYKEEKENLETSMQKCERLMSSIENTMESSRTAVERNDNVNTILLYQRGQSEVESYQDLVTEMRKSFTSVRIKHIVDPSLLNLDKDIPLTLGTVSVQKQPKRLPGQVTCLLSECHVKEVGKFSIKCPSDGSDCLSAGVVYLPDDHVVVGDWNNSKIKLFTVSGKCLDEMNVPGNPYDMCRVDDHTVAVAIATSARIHVIRVHFSKLNLSSKIILSNDKSPYSLTYTGDSFITSTPKEMYNVGKNGDEKHIYTYPANCCHLVYDAQTRHIYGTQVTSQNGAVAVYRHSGETSTDLATVGVLKDTFGVDIDVEGNLYVCGRASNNVVQMSGDGTHVREILTSSDGVNMPRAISVCGNKFVVTNKSSRNMNEVRVFQLY